MSIELADGIGTELWYSHGQQHHFGRARDDYCVFDVEIGLAWFLLRRRGVSEKPFEIFSDSSDKCAVWLAPEEWVVGVLFIVLKKRNCWSHSFARLYCTCFFSMKSWLFQGKSNNLWHRFLRKSSCCCFLFEIPRIFCTIFFPLLHLSRLLNPLTLRPKKNIVCFLLLSDKE